MKIKKIICAVIFVIATLSLLACNDTQDIKNNSLEGHNKTETAEVAQYTCPMHPHYISTDADGSCPICGMDLVPIIKDLAVDDFSESGEISSRIEISVSSSIIQTIGVRTQPAQINEFGGSLRAFGTVEADERSANSIVARIEGWIEGLEVNAEGDLIKNGDLLFYIYSPDLIAIQQDYLNALSSRNSNRIKAIEQRLISIGMQPQVIKRLIKEREIIQKVPVYAQRNGIVDQLNIREGDYLKPGAPIFHLQSYEQVWVIASIPETSLSLIKNDVIASLTFPSVPSVMIESKIDYIYPTIDAKTRTGKVRIVIDNKKEQFLPGAYADIKLNFDLKPRLSVASESILQDSSGTHVILALGEGRFTTRKVTTGIHSQGQTEILNGLNEGDIVVTSGQFMLDSEVNLREGFKKLSVSTTESVTNSESTNGSIEDINVDSNTLAQIDHIIDAALYFHSSLVEGDTIKPTFIEPAITLTASLIERFSGTELESILRDSQQVLIDSKNALNNDALVIQLDRLVKAIEPWILEGAPEHYSQLGLKLYRETETHRLWLQIKGSVVNPYNDKSAELINLDSKVKQHIKHH